MPRNDAADLLVQRVRRKVSETRAEAWRKRAGLDAEPEPGYTEAFYSEEGERAVEPPGEWEKWLSELFPGSFTEEHSERHREAFDFVWNAKAGVSYPAQIWAWPRGGGKTTVAETATVIFGARKSRGFVLYVKETQKQANGAVANVAAKLQSARVERYYPALSDRALNKFGLSKGYTQSALRTASGFVVMGLGLDAAARGLKEEDLRPDVIILDDIDNRHDTPAAVKKKIETLTQTVLPLGTNETIVLFCQNPIHGNSIMQRLIDGRADFLLWRHVSGPYPSIRGLRIEWEYVEKLGRRAPVIKAGVPTWKGQSLEACQDLIWRFGLRAFLRENQHRVKLVEGAFWKEEEIAEQRVEGKDIPKAFVYVTVGVDPSGNKGKEGETNDPEKPAGNECGIVVEGLGYDGKIYTLADESIHGSPDEWGRKVIETALEWDADDIAAERNYGGEMVRSVIHNAARSLGYDLLPVPVVLVNATRGKDIRAEPVAQLTPDGYNKWAGIFPELEDEAVTWTKDAKWSPNRLDAKVWASTRLLKYLRKRDRKPPPSSQIVTSS